MLGMFQNVGRLMCLEESEKRRGEQIWVLTVGKPLENFILLKGHSGQR